MRKELQGLQRWGVCGMIERKVCPRCGEPCKLRSVSCFDPSGERYGAMFVCPRCQWDDWGNIVSPGEIRDFYAKEATEENKENDK